MTPDYLAAQTDAHRVQQFRPAYFVVLLRREPGNHKVAVLAEDEKAVAVLGDKRGSFERAAFFPGLAVHRPGSSPEAFSGSNAHGSEDADAVDAVGDAVLYKRRAAYRGQPDGPRGLPHLPD